MNFCSFIFLFIFMLSVLLAAKENIRKKDLFKQDNKNSSSNFHKNIPNVKCFTKVSVYHELSTNDNSYENFVKYNKEGKPKILYKEKIDEKYSKNVLNNKNNEDIFESVKRVECCDYKNKMIKVSNAINTSYTILKKTSRTTRFKNKLYKMIFKRNKFWRVISGIITILGDSAIICQIIMLIGYILKCVLDIGTCCEIIYCNLIMASSSVFGVITLLIILLITIVWLVVTWLWSHKDVYYETHEK
ncbi:putative exported protein [Plasmodium reichenowi]|uniref:Putative exported protein n=1 Tax=Plasmodium reichenowi TaxID=5854 RepID=A0A151L2R2_PLARE|nr:putative exported protein [Plasmodium reichenowi]KYN93184.1 putative exported protein [Plasmodium reichenowi]